MNAALRDLLTQRADDAGTPDLDIDELVALGEHRLRRRRASAVLGAATAVVVVIALAVGAASNGPVKRGGGPVDHPAHSPNEPVQQPVRKIVYSDGYQSQAIHFGDHVVETGNGFVHMDVTDDGFVYQLGVGAWFSDGGTPEQIGSHMCGSLPHGNLHNSTRVVMSANTGSLVAWLDCTQAGRAALVVFDTASRREVAHRPIPLCGTGPSLSESCELFGLVGGQVYLNEGSYAGSPRPEYRFDVMTGRLSATTAREYAQDVRSHPRGLVVGDSWQTGITTDGIYQSFRVVGSRLVPQLNYDSDWHLAKAAFDTATGRALLLRLPEGYRSDASGFDVFEWLDDDTLALVSSGDLATGDILKCRLSDGRCVVAVRATKGDTSRIVPNFGLPG